MQLINKDALFSDETSNYRQPVEAKAGDVVTIRFRTKQDDVDKITIVSGESRVAMRVVSQTAEYDYYAADVGVGEQTIRYYFEIAGQARNDGDGGNDEMRNDGSDITADCHSGPRAGISYQELLYFNKLGVVDDVDETFSFSIIPGFSTPKWAKGAVMYQIYPDRFFNGDTSNDVLDGEYSYICNKVTKQEDWYAYPYKSDVNNFYGGDLQGIIDKLDYLQWLGIEVLYLNPIFVSPSNHKYDIQDYDYVDPHFGKIVEDEGELLSGHDFTNNHSTRYVKRVTDHANLEASNEVFIRLSEEVHKRGMKIILDGVFNHCGSFNKWLDRERIYEKEEGYEKGAYIDRDSPYRSFFKFGNENWPYNDSYLGWWDHDTLPKLNYEDSPKLEQYILEVAAKWVSPPFNADGWRLDVAADLGQSEEYNHLFWKKFRKVVKKANPEALILAEHYGNAKSWLAGDEWDTVMNYDGFMEPISWFLTGMQKHSDGFREDLLGNAGAFFGAMKYAMSEFTNSSLSVAMNQLDNHDHSRFLTRTNGCVGRVEELGSNAADDNVDVATLKEAVVMQMTWPGAPTLYYGDEAGVCGFTDPDNRRSYPWGRENRELLEFYQAVIKVHKDYKVFTEGSIRELYAAHNLLSYGRFTEGEQAIVIINNGWEEAHMEIEVWPTGISRSEETTLKQIFYTDKDNTEAAEEFVTTTGILDITLGAKGAMILYHQEKEMG